MCITVEMILVLEEEMLERAGLSGLLQPVSHSLTHADLTFTHSGCHSSVHRVHAFTLSTFHVMLTMLVHFPAAN